MSNYESLSDRPGVGSFLKGVGVGISAAISGNVGAWAGREAARAYIPARARPEMTPMLRAASEYFAAGALGSTGALVATAAIVASMRPRPLETEAATYPQ